ncbi:MAG: hypothetical protein HOU81_01395 [Hamadaea sp.]|uniref:hypothetical protein n=1 Tax=Hamadaea sp. TaxID=2024425 RepID=UPI0017F43184|nr:hypothetical protein [Hamadaea sp.]NUR69453.1 hypothetical protein [Hamadaea sp.]NUT23384.1 hypothetical protein [Hamadaea sp.]
MTLPDEVWHTLDRDAGRLSRRTFRLLVVGLAVLALAGATTVAGWQTFTAPLTFVGNSSSETMPYPMRFSTTFEVRNDGRVPITIEGVGRGDESLSLLSAWASPETVPPGEMITMHLEYAVTDCRDYPHGSWPMPVRVKRPWGTQTLYVMPPSEPSPDAPSEYWFTGESDPYALQWQESFVRMVCSPRP